MEAFDSLPNPVEDGEQHVEIMWVERRRFGVAGIGRRMEMRARCGRLRMPVPPTLEATVVVSLFDVVNGVVAGVEPANVEPGGRDGGRIRTSSERNAENTGGKIRRVERPVVDEWVSRGALGERLECRDVEAALGEGVGVVGHPGSLCGRRFAGSAVGVPLGPMNRLLEDFEVVADAPPASQRVPPVVNVFVVDILECRRRNCVGARGVEAVLERLVFRK
uniref:hypothetical protein n=1 Tax=Halocalculus aciditolerans TaxID=1383812 RepID=UPI001666C2F5|nr:hypothetical protein [Halocalculus aciditolerans]